MNTAPHSQHRLNVFLIFLLLAAFLLIVFFLLLTNQATHLGQNIPLADLPKDYVYGMGTALTLGISIIFWPVSSKDKEALLIAWLVKAIICLSFMLFYESHYSVLDAYSYFNAPRFEGFSGFAFGEGTENINSLVWLLYKVSPESYHSLKVIFAMIGLIAVYIFYRGIVICTKKESLKLFFFFAFFPSILFWSSIVGKDPIVLLGIAIYFYGVIAFLFKKNFKNLILILIGTGISALIRSWLGPILMAPLLFLIFKTSKSIFLKTSLILLTSATIFLFSGKLLETFAIESTYDLFSNLDSQSRAWSEDGDSGQEIKADLTDPNQVIRFLPIGIFTALFRPLPGEIRNLFGTLSGLENLFLLLMIARFLKNTRLSDLSDPIIIWSILLVLCWSGAYAFISYQNLGTAVRFRTQILPVMLFIVIYLRNKYASKLH